MLSVKLNRRQLTDVFKFVGVAVGDLVAFQVIIFELSVKCRRTKSVGVAVGDMGGISSNYFMSQNISSIINNYFK